jgi:hypothetical protein
MKSPIFIFSLPRSGSTLLQRVLMGHEKIKSIAEPWLLLPFCYAYKKEGTLAEYGHESSYNAFEDFVNNLPNKENDYYEALGNFAQTLYDLQCKDGEIFFLDKTPRYYQIIPQIAKSFPDAKFIFLFRNPVHVVSSIMQTWSNGGFRHMHPYYVDIKNGPELLSNGYKSIREKSYALKYEDFVQSPEKYTKEICEYLKIEFNKHMLENFTSQNSEFNGKMGDPTGVKDYQLVDTKPLEKWRDTFNTNYRRNYIMKYVESLNEYDLKVQGYKKEGILKEVSENTVSKECFIQDRVGALISYLARILKPNIFLRKKKKYWAAKKYLS